VKTYWEQLLKRAFAIMDKAKSMGAEMDGVTLGGGTAIMLHIDHRDSHDIDLFLSDADSLVALEEIVRNLAKGENLEFRGAEGSYISLNDSRLGEIDFIYGRLAGVNADASVPGWWQPAVRRELAGRPIWLETVPEIIGKKIYYRCTSLTPRDVFDIAAACEAGYREDIRKIMSSMPKEVATAAWVIENFPDGHVKDRMQQYDVRPKFRHLLDDAPDIVISMIDNQDLAATGRSQRSHTDNWTPPEPSPFD